MRSEITNTRYTELQRQKKLRKAVALLNGIREVTYSNLCGYIGYCHACSEFN